MPDAEMKEQPSKLEQASKFVGVLNEFSKFGATAAFALVAIAAIASPVWVKDRLGQLGLQVQEVDTGFVKLVAKETVKAGTNSLQIAENLTVAEVALSELKAPPQGAAADAVYAAAVRDTEEAIRRARSALEEQSSSLQSAGKKAGVQSNAPVRGWLYVGYFGEDGRLRKPSDRISSGDGIRYAGGRMAEVALRFDAAVVSDGDDCTKTSVENFVPPDPNSPERKFAIIRAAGEPLKVLTTKECVAPGRGKTIYAQVEVPGSRVRFAGLSTLRQ